jgi:argininosuccinate lyase
MRATVTGNLYATDLAELLVGGGMPFREAHRKVGELVSALERDGRSVTDIAAKEWPGLLPELGADVATLLDPDASVRRRATPGGTSPESVAAQTAEIRRRAAGIRSRTARSSS